MVLWDCTCSPPALWWRCPRPEQLTDLLGLRALLCADPGASACEREGWEEGFLEVAHPVVPEKVARHSMAFARLVICKSQRGFL